MNVAKIQVRSHVVWFCAHVYFLLTISAPNIQNSIFECNRSALPTGKKHAAQKYFCSQMTHSRKCGLALKAKG